MDKALRAKHRFTGKATSGLTFKSIHHFIEFARDRGKGYDDLVNDVISNGIAVTFSNSMFLMRKYWLIVGAAYIGFNSSRSPHPRGANIVALDQLGMADEDINLFLTIYREFVRDHYGDAIDEDPRTTVEFFIKVDDGLLTELNDIKRL